MPARVPGGSSIEGVPFPSRDALNRGPFALLALPAHPPTFLAGAAKYSPPENFGLGIHAGKAAVTIFSKCSSTEPGYPKFHCAASLCLVLPAVQDHRPQRPLEATETQLSG